MPVAGLLLGSVACDLNFDYEGTPVEELTPLQQSRFCGDVAMEVARSYIGEYKVVCVLAAAFTPQDTCAVTFDDCAADFDPSMLMPNSKGVVVGEDRCNELFDEGAFAGCQIDAALYAACATETAAFWQELDGEELCTPPAEEPEDTNASDGEAESSETASEPAGDAGVPGDGGAPGADEPVEPNPYTPSCAEMERLCPNNPFTPEAIGEAVAAYDAEQAGGDAGTPDDAAPAGDAGPAAADDGEG